MIAQTAEYYNKRWTETIQKLPKGGEYRNDLRKAGWKIIADYIGKDKLVFEFATGISSLPEMLNDNDCIVSGCDFSQVAVDYASQWGDFSVGGEIIGYYDYITACQFIEHIENPVEWLNDALKHAPIVICSIPNNFRQEGDHYLMQWSNWDEFNDLFKDFDVERIDEPKHYAGIHKAWNHPVFVFKKKESSNG